MPQVTRRHKSDSVSVLRSKPAVALVALVWLVCLGAAASLTNDIYRSIASAAISRSDSVEYTLAQTEVELLRFLSAANQARQGPPDALANLRLAFDVLYSRLGVLQTGSAYRSAQDHEVFRTSLATARDFMESTVPQIDSPDPVLRAALPEIIQRASSLQPVIRAMVLDGLHHFTAENDFARNRTVDTLLRLSLLVLALILTAAAFLVVLLRSLGAERRTASAAISAASRLDKILSTSLGAIIVTDRTGRVRQMNRAAETTFGYTQAEALGQPVGALVVPQSLRAAHEHGMLRVLQTGEYHMVGRGRVETVARSKDRGEFPVEMSIDMSSDDQGEFYVAYVQDISDRRAKEREIAEQNEALQKEAYWDRLTGAMRRTRLQELYSDGIRIRDYVLGAFDIDDFKAINSNFGHATGDHILYQISTALSDAMPETEAFCRYGGEEFVALIPCDRIKGSAQDYFARVLHRIAETEFGIDGETLHCTVTCGFSTLAAAGSLSTAAEQADTALRHAKAIGKNCAVEASASLLNELGYVANPPSRSSVVEAIKSGDLRYHVQPIIDMRTKDIVGYEALLRWITPAGTMVPLPAFLGQFTSIIRDAAMLPHIRNMLATGLPPLADLKRKRAYVSFNFESYDLFHTFERNALTLALREAAAQGYRIAIEMLETAHNRKVTEAQTDAMFRNIAAAGFELFLDDFGKDAASLERLSNYEFACIKLDRSLIDGLERSERKRRVVELVVRLGRLTKTRIVAEGVETEEQMARLKSLGIRYGQGFLFGRPAPYRPPLRRAKAQPAAAGPKGPTAGSS